MVDVEVRNPVRCAVQVFRQEFAVVAAERERISHGLLRRGMSKRFVLSSEVMQGHHER